MRNKTKLTVGLWEGEKQTIESAARAMGLSMSEFTKSFALIAANQVLDAVRPKPEPYIDAEVVEPMPVSLPNVPTLGDLATAEKALQTRFRARRVLRRHA